MASPRFAQGYILLFSLVFFAICLTITIAFVGSITTYAKSARFAVSQAQALSLAEAGIDKATYALNQNGSYTGETNTALGGGTFTTSVTAVDSNTKRITSTGVRSGSSVTVKANVGITTDVVSFQYGVQIGNGGLEMSNTSKIIGNAYSNGNIIGTNSARIQGTAVVTGATGIIDGMDIDEDAWSHTIRGSSTVGGNATHAVLQQTTVTGNVVADSISNCTIGGTATYDTRSGCTVSGAVTTPNPAAFVPAAALPLPISEAQIDEWEAEAAEGGTVGTQTFSDGSRSLGPKKISGDLILSGTAELVVTGTLWVTGEIKLSNTSKIRLHGSYGSNSGVIVAGVDESTSAGYIELSNSAQVLGSGSPSSHVMLLSQREMGSNAIKTTNSSAVAILYAGEGQIEIANSAALKEITANKLKITNSATVTYESGLQNVNFASGPGGSWVFLPGSYAIIP